MARSGGLRAIKGACSQGGLATRPSQTLSFLLENEQFCKIALLHLKMVGIVSGDLFLTSWSHSERARGSESTHLVATDASGTRRIS